MFSIIVSQIITLITQNKTYYKINLYTTEYTNLESSTSQFISYV